MFPMPRRSSSIGWRTRISTALAHSGRGSCRPATFATPQKLGLKLWVNDVIKQDSNTAQMIFTIAEQIAHLSSRITLNPGDVILTGTPSGVGAARQEFLVGGDVVRLWIEHIGTLVNRMA